MTSWVWLRQAYIIIYQNVQQASVMSSLENHQTKGLGMGFLIKSEICYAPLYQSLWDNVYDGCSLVCRSWLKDPSVWTGLFSLFFHSLVCRTWLKDPSLNRTLFSILFTPFFLVNLFFPTSWNLDMYLVHDNLVSLVHIPSLDISSMIHANITYFVFFRWMWAQTHFKVVSSSFIKIILLPHPGIERIICIDLFYYF